MQLKTEAKHSQLLQLYNSYRGYVLLSVTMSSTILKKKKHVLQHPLRHLLPPWVSPPLTYALQTSHALLLLSLTHLGSVITHIGQ